MNERPMYRLRVYGKLYIGGMKLGDRHGRTANPALAVMFTDRAEADAAAIVYDAWVEQVDQSKLTETP